MNGPVRRQGATTPPYYAMRGKTSVKGEVLQTGSRATDGRGAATPPCYSIHSNGVVSKARASAPSRALVRKIGSSSAQHKSLDSEQLMLESSVQTLPPGVASCVQMPPAGVGIEQLSSATAGSMRVRPGAIPNDQGTNGSAQKPPAAFGSVRMLPGAASGVQMPPAAVGSVKIPPAAAGSVQMLPAAAGSVRIPPGAVGSVQMPPGALGTVQLQSAATGSVQMPPGTPHLPSGGASPRPLPRADLPAPIRWSSAGPMLPTPDVQSRHLRAGALRVATASEGAEISSRGQRTSPAHERRGSPFQPEHRSPPAQLRHISPPIIRATHAQTRGGGQILTPRSNSALPKRSPIHGMLVPMGEGPAPQLSDTSKSSPGSKGRHLVNAPKTAKAAAARGGTQDSAQDTVFVMSHLTIPAEGRRSETSTSSPRLPYPFEPVQAFPFSSEPPFAIGFSDLFALTPQTPVIPNGWLGLAHPSSERHVSPTGGYRASTTPQFDPHSPKNPGRQSPRSPHAPQGRNSPQLRGSSPGSSVMAESCATIRSLEVRTQHGLELANAQAVVACSSSVSPRHFSGVARSPRGTPSALTPRHIGATTPQMQRVAKSSWTLRQASGQLKKSTPRPLQAMPPTPRATIASVAALDRVQMTHLPTGSRFVVDGTGKRGLWVDEDGQVLEEIRAI